MNIALALGRVGGEGAKGTDVLCAVLVDETEDNSARSGSRQPDPAGPRCRGLRPLADTLKNTKNPAALRLAAVKALAKVEGETKDVWSTKVALDGGDATLRLFAVRAATAYAKEQPEVVQFVKTRAFHSQRGIAWPPYRNPQRRRHYRQEPRAGLAVPHRQ